MPLRVSTSQNVGVTHPGAIQNIVDLLGPPPATIIAWEQQQLAQSCTHAASSEADQPQLGGRGVAAGSVRVVSGSGSSSSTGPQGVRGIREHSAESLKARASRTGAVAEALPAVDSDGIARNTLQEQQGTGKTRRKWVRDKH